MYYMNSILFGLPDTQIKKFQYIQNMCTKLLLDWGNFDSKKPSPQNTSVATSKIKNCIQSTVNNIKKYQHPRPEYLKTS